jgi:hypothetical protein
MPVLNWFKSLNTPLRIIMSVAILNAIVGVINLFVPQDVKIYGHIFMLVLLSIELIVCSLVWHCNGNFNKDNS